MSRVPFTLPDIGLREIEGVVAVTGGFLVITFKNALFGVMDVDKETVKIEPQALEEVRIKYGIMKDRLILIPKGDALYDIIPGNHKLGVALRVWRIYRGELEALVQKYEALGADEQ